MKKIVLGCAALLLSLGLLAGCNDNPSTVDAVIINVDSSASVVVGETLELPYSVEPEKATVVAASDHEEYVTADAQDGILYLHGVTEGSAIVTLVGTYKKYAEANVNINVSVVTEATEKTEPGTPDTGGEGGPSTTYPAPTGEEDPAYFGFEVDGVGYYMTGETVGSYTYEGALTTSVNDAVLVSIEKGEAENEFYLSFGEAGSEKYITIVSGDYTNLSYSEAKAPIYWNETYGCWGNEEATHFICYNSTYGCLYVSALSSYGPDSSNPSPIATLIEPAEVSELTILGSTEVYETSSIRLTVVANLGASNSVVWTVESNDDEGNATVEDGVVTGVTAGVVTVTATSTENENVSASVDITVNAIPDVLPFELNKPYWFGYEYNSKTYYFAGAITSNYYGEVTATEGAGTEVIVSEVEGGYTLGFTDSDGEQQYIYLYGSDSNFDFGIQTEPFAFTYDYSLQTFVAEANEALCYIGNYYKTGTTYNELRAMKVDSYGTEEGTTYCVAHLIEPPVPTSLVISGSSTVEVNRSTLLTVVDEEGRSTPVTWSSSATGVATVSDTGVVTGVSTGSATITATSTRDTSISADFSITVTEYVARTEVKIGTYDFTTKDATYDTSTGVGTGAYSSGDTLKATFDTYWVGQESYSNPLSSITETANIYNYANSGTNTSWVGDHGLLKTGGASNNGVIKMTLTNTITKVEINQTSWTTGENCTITVNTVSHKSATAGTNETLTFEIAEATTLDMTFAKRCAIYSIALYGYVD